MDRKEEINKEIDSLETRIIVLRREREDIIKKENPVYVGKELNYKLFIWEHGQCMQIHERSPDKFNFKTSLRLSVRTQYNIGILKE